MTLRTQAAFRHVVVLAALTTLLAVATPPLAADGGPVGKWNATLETQRGASEVAMEFSENDDGLVGIWTGPRGTADLDDVAYEDGKLSFVRNLNVQGREITLRYSATIDGDTMDVTMTTPRGERQFVAQRAE